MTEEGGHSGYQFSEDWFHWAPEVWERIVPLLPERKSFLEVGTFEGRSAVWMVENMIEDGGAILCIDTWGGGEEHVIGCINMQAAEEAFDANIATLKERYPDRAVVKLKGESFDELVELANAGVQPLDFAYIDGSHRARDVITDACLVWPLLKPGGVLAFDDYLWGHSRDVLHRPKLAIDAFTTMFAEDLEVVHVGYQFIVKKREG